MFFQHMRTLDQTMSKYLRVPGNYERQSENLVAGLFSLLRSFVLSQAGFVLLVSIQHTCAQRDQRVHTLKARHRNRKGLSGQGQNNVSHLVNFWGKGH